MVPFAAGETPLRRPRTSDDTPPVKSIRLRSVCASAVGSSVASWLPACTDGPLKPPPEKLTLRTPVKLMKVGSATVVSDDTLLLGAVAATFTTSLPKPMSTTPTMREPFSSVSVSAALDSRIAVPPVPMMAPALVMVAASTD